MCDACTRSASAALGLSREQRAALAASAVRASFLDPATRQSLTTEIEATADRRVHAISDPRGRRRGRRTGEGRHPRPAPWAAAAALPADGAEVGASSQPAAASPAAKTSAPASHSINIGQLTSSELTDAIEAVEVLYKLVP